MAVIADQRAVAFIRAALAQCLSRAIRTSSGDSDGLQQQSTFQNDAFGVP